MKNYPTFRGVLRTAICRRTQAQFANESNISAGYLNRLLNKETISRPTENTLYKIASAAKNGITMQMLQEALDADDPDIHAAERREKLAEAQREFAPTFTELANETMKALTDKIAALSYPIVTTDKEEFINTLLTNTKPLEVSYDMNITGIYPKQGLHNYAAYYQGVTLTMADSQETAITEMILFYSMVPCSDKTTRYLIQFVSCRLDDTSDVYGIPPYFSDAVDDEDETIFKHPYALEIHPILTFQEKYIPVGASAEERCLHKIFGEVVEHSETTDGIGFWLKDVPSGFATFMEKHLNQVLTGCDTDEAKTQLRVAIESKNNDQIITALMDLDFMDEELDSDFGWPSAITRVMQMETGFPFLYKAKADDDTFPNLSEHPCILLPKKLADMKAIQREAILMATCKYVRELGIETFGDILFTGVKKTNFRKPMTYTPSKEEPAAKTKPNHKPDYRCLYNDRQQPEKTALYHCRLVDGREMVALYIAKEDRWIAYHKDWRNWVEAYDPEPIQQSEID